MTNIPIYRAKRLDNCEYVEGYYFFQYGMNKIKPINSTLESEEIDLSTLAIHFPDMLDKNNKPIFASFSEDGRGGDVYIKINDIQPSGVIHHSEDIERVFIFYADGILARVVTSSEHSRYYNSSEWSKYAKYKITGIYEGDK